jgi:hypothetical protein
LYFSNLKYLKYWKRILRPWNWARPTATAPTQPSHWANSFSVRVVHQVMRLTGGAAIIRPARPGFPAAYLSTGDHGVMPPTITAPTVRLRPQSCPTYAACPTSTGSSRPPTECHPLVHLPSRHPCVSRLYPHCAWAIASKPCSLSPPRCFPSSASPALLCPAHRGAVPLLAKRCRR